MDARTVQKMIQGKIWCVLVFTVPYTCTVQFILELVLIYNFFSEDFVFFGYGPDPTKLPGSEFTVQMYSTRTLQISY